MDIMKAYVHTKSKREAGTYDCYLTQEVQVKETSLPRKGQTITGYGKAMPTRYMVLYNSKWQRVKVVNYSNNGSAYIGKTYSPCLTVDIER